MPRRETPTIRRRLLGQELRNMRLMARISPADAAKALDITTSSLSRIETGKQTIREPYVRVIASMCNIFGEDLDDLLTLCEEAARPEWYQALAGSSPTWFRQYLGLEGAASEIRTYTVELIDGLLQTEDYARAVALANQPDASERDLDGYVALRRGRQEQLLGDDGPRLHVIVNQLALVSGVGGRDVMRGQCQRLIELSSLPHVTLQVLPFGVGAHPSMTSGFTLLGFDENAGMATVVYIDVGRGAVYPDAPADLAQYRWKFDQLVGKALTPAKSRDLLARVDA